MSEKTFKIVNSDLSDGYHTFDELYEHRNKLFIILGITLDNTGLGEVVWGSHHYPGWDVIRMDTPFGQISYHVPVELRPLYQDNLKQVSLVELEATFDGHTSDEVARRLSLWAKKYYEEEK